MQPDQPTPQTPQEPTPSAQPPVVPQPAPNANVVNGMPAPTIVAKAKSNRTALWMGIASLALFVVAFFTGYAAYLGVFLGAFGAATAIRAKMTKTPIVIGFIGMGLNMLLFIVGGILLLTGQQ